MCHLNCNTKKENYKHLTYAERTMIERWYNKDKKSKKEIADLLEKSERTIRREINIGLVEIRGYMWEELYEYSAMVAQEKYEYNKTAKGPDLKLDQDLKLVEHIENQILNEKKSPEVVSLELKQYGFDVEVSGRTIRNAIKLGNVFNKIKQGKITKNASVFGYFSAIAGGFLFMIGIDWINPYLLYSLVSVFGLASLFSFVRASKSKGKLDDLDKNMYFLEIEEKLNNNLRKRNQNILVNTSKKTRDIVNNTSEDKPVFNINSFNYVPYSDIEQIMLNIERNERFGFDYEYSEVQEKGRTKKKTR